MLISETFLFRVEIFYTLSLLKDGFCLFSFEKTLLKILLSQFGEDEQGMRLHPVIRKQLSQNWQKTIINDTL